MSDISKEDRTILELTNIKPRSKKYLSDQLYEHTGLTPEQSELTINALVNRNRLAESKGMYKSDPDLDYYLYPPAIDELMSNAKAIHKVITLANKAYYPNLTLKEFEKKYKPGVERQIMKKVLITAYDQGFLRGLPVELRTKKSVNQRIKRLGTWYSKLIANIESHPIIKTISIVILLATVVMTIAWFVSPAFQEFLKTIF